MKRFQYSLEALRRYRQLRVDACRQAIGEAERQVSQEELAAARLADRQAQAFAERRSLATGADAITALRHAEGCLAMLRQQRALQASRLARAQLQLETCRQQLTQARLAADQLDEHREQQHTEWAHSLRQAETRLLDELATGRHARHAEAAHSQEDATR